MWYVAGIPIIPRNYAMVVNAFLWTTLALIVISFRFWTRAVLVKKVGWDDWLMLAAMCTSLVFLISIFYQVKFGLGLPVDPNTLVPFLAALYVTIPLYNLTQTLYKLSITLQSYRLFSTATGKRAIKILMCWVLFCGVGTIFSSLFHCVPVSQAWDVFGPGYCVSNAPLNFTISAFNILNDVFLLAIPMLFLRNLQMNEKQRIVLMSIFACGFIITIVSIIRLKALYDNVKGPPEEQPISGVDIALWSGLEINMAIICGSVPALKAFVSQVILRKTDSSASGYGYGVHSSTGNGRKKDRGRSHTLESGVSERSFKKDQRLQINVRESIEMSRFGVNDDTGSENDLIIQGQKFEQVQVPATVVKITTATAGGGRHSVVG